VGPEAEVTPDGPEAGATGETIRFYRAVGPNGYLSNLWPCPLRLWNLPFGSSEHAYQFRKPKDPRVGNWILSAPTPRLAAIAGHHLPVYDVRDDWAEAKLTFMREAVDAKFRQNPDLAERLLATGGARLVEESPDAFWGEGRERNGKNWLGVILMETRSRIRGAAP
jgi:hypothetical protein